jgi:hypothetical protein
MRHARYVHGKAGAQHGYGHVRTDAPHPQVLGHVLAKANGSRCMCLEILTFGRKVTIRTNEEQIV